MSCRSHKAKALLLAALGLALFGIGLGAQEPSGPPLGRERGRQEMRRPRGAGPERWLRSLFLRVAEVPPEQQTQVLENDEFFRRLPPLAQERFRRRLSEFNALPAEQRQVMLERVKQGGGERPAQALFLRVAPLPPEEQERALAGDESFAILPPPVQERFRRQLGRFNLQPPEEKNRILGRMQRFAELSPEQQELLRHRARRFAGMSPEQRGQARRAFEAWQQLPAERRRLLTERLRRLQEASPEQRRLLLEDQEFLAPLDEQERRLLVELWSLRQNLPPVGTPEAP